MSDANALGSLPEWDLDELYPGQESPELEADLKSATEDADAFAKAYEGKLVGLDGAGLAAALEPMPKCTMFRRTAGLAGILPGRVWAAKWLWRAAGEPSGQVSGAEHPLQACLGGI